MNFNFERLNRQKEEIEALLKSYQGVIPNKDLIEWRILNENEEVDNLYVQNKTLFISDNIMVLKGVDGRTEKWEIKKIYPIDKKDQKINELEEELRKLKEMINNEYSKPTSTVRKSNKSNADANGNVESKSETSGECISE